MMKGYRRYCYRVMMKGYRRYCYGVAMRAKRSRVVVFQGFPSSHEREKTDDCAE